MKYPPWTLIEWILSLDLRKASSFLLVPKKNYEWNRFAMNRWYAPTKAKMVIYQYRNCTSYAKYIIGISSNWRGKTHRNPFDIDILNFLSYLSDDIDNRQDAKLANIRRKAIGIIKYVGRQQPILWHIVRSVPLMKYSSFPLSVLVVIKLASSVRCYFVFKYENWIAEMVDMRVWIFGIFADNIL